MNPRFPVDEGWRWKEGGWTRKVGRIRRGRHRPPPCASVQRVQVRAIDDFTATGVNDCAAAAERCRVDSLDALVEMARIAAAAGTPVLSKEDFVGAYKTLPVRGADLPLAHAAWAKGACEGYCLQLLSCPFGAVGSGYAWDRVGAVFQARGAGATATRRAPRARQAILAKLFWLASGRFVDDLFRADADRGPGTGGPRDAAEVLRAVVEDLLGWRLDAGKRVVAEPRANVLGVDAEVRGSGKELSLVFAIGDDKRHKWIQEIEWVLAAGRMSPAAASKLAGRLGWGSSAVFGRGTLWPPRANNARAGAAAGARVYLAPLFWHAQQRGWRLESRLRKALEWWLRFLRSAPERAVPLRVVPNRPRYLVYSDATGGGRRRTRAPARHGAHLARARAATAGSRGSSPGPTVRAMRRLMCRRRSGGGRSTARRRRGRPGHAGSDARPSVCARSQHGSSSRQYAPCIICSRRCVMRKSCCLWIQRRSPARAARLPARCPAGRARPRSGCSCAGPRAKQIITRS